jgi:large subunit ribosomal protein L32e
MRRKIKGWPPTVNVGYRGPKVARGLHPSGYREVLVYNADDVKRVDPKTHAVRIAHTVGKRERTKILAESRKRKITVLNIKEIKEVVKEEKEKKEEKLEKEEEVVKKEKPKQKRERKKKPKRREEKQ